MELSTAGLTLTPDTPIDLQIHTTFSDGIWEPEQLLDHLKREGFGLAAVTDHDRVDSVTAIQALAIQKNMPILVAVEMTTEWVGNLTDILCFGFDPERNHLNKLAQDVVYRQKENTREVFENLTKKGFRFSKKVDELSEILEKPTPQQLHELVALLKRYGYGTGDPSAGQIILDAGGVFAMNDIATVVDAAHQDGGVAIIAHPGRGDGFVTYDKDILDHLREDVPFDGIEVYYPVHTEAQTTKFLKYAKRHKLLISSGSDSHIPERPPIKYPAKLSQSLLERVGIHIE